MSGPVLMASPHTPGPHTPQPPASARKAPSTVTPSKSRTSKPSSTNSSTTKRKVKDENASPKDATPSKARGRNKSANPRAPAVRKESAKKEKKQKVTHEPEMGHQPPHVMQSIENQSPPTPLDTPSPSQNVPTQALSPPSQSNTNNYSQATLTTGRNAYSYDQIALLVYRNDPTLLPEDLTTPVHSLSIDKFTHALWTILLHTAQLQAMFQRTTNAGALMTESRLRVLALLNIMPSWWYLRERVVLWLESVGRPIDDSWQLGLTNRAMAQARNLT